MKKVIILSTLAMFISTALGSQISVPVGDGMLYAAIEFAADGDELLLIPGGVYTESTQFEFGTLVGKNLTIRVDGDGSEKAIVRMLTPGDGESTPVFFEVGHESGLYLNGIEFDGSQNGNPFIEDLVNFYMGEYPAETNVNTIHIENCYIHDLLGQVLKSGNADMADYVVVDSTIINNTITRTTGTIVYYKYAGANYISLTNSTFDTINSYGLRIAGPGYTFKFDNTPTVIVDYTTWYNVGTEDGREILLAERGPNLNPWTVSNSIFQQQILKSKTFINIKETTGDSLATISNIGFWDIGAINFRLHTVTDTLRADPGFYDAANGDFTLASGSPMLFLGAGYLPIGDPRWTENWTVDIDTRSHQSPQSHQLVQNYPNPFNPSTTISFELDISGPTRLGIYDLKGKMVAELVNENLTAGNHSVKFTPETLTSGTYLYRLESAGVVQTKKMIYLK